FEGRVASRACKPVFAGPATGGALSGATARAAARHAVCQRPTTYLAQLTMATPDHDAAAGCPQTPSLAHPMPAPGAVDGIEETDRDKESRHRQGADGPHASAHASSDGADRPSTEAGLPGSAAG